jgi:hypothetical protein
MKQLADGQNVTSRSYYYLLDFNDRDGWKTIMAMFNKPKLLMLVKDEYLALFKAATQIEINKLIFCQDE